MYINKDGGAQCVADNEDDEREILPYPGTKSKSGDMEILWFLQISSQSADGTKLKLCQEPFANSAGERTPIKGCQRFRPFPGSALFKFGPLIFYDLFPVELR